ncbi:Lrp/AsnC family transcriptional regulator [Sphingomonas sp. DG1-23]|uniref:Lrp/AsnC family transcriptional regulator n=1 Tax=Sphingomonas sp. DG1-23 TaxID=3068316 RepID=UPI00273E10E0|nr:Lrp/AsnC family transcriptional regulator [Sphingomonas sp. DG1-23]MDP5277484.1 Lrp/AsnC family transcriptional regulator [Sphingomonas sp. DG1-23]
MTHRAPEELDLQLLALLRADSRRNVSELAAALGVSRTSVYSSIERLERQETIVGYTVRLGEEYDRRQIRAHVMIKLYPKATSATQDQLMTMPEVAGLYAISGEYDLIAVVEAPHVNRLNDLLDAIGALEGVERTTSSVILATKLQR